MKKKIFALAAAVIMMFSIATFTQAYSGTDDETAEPMYMGAHKNETEVTNLHAQSNFLVINNTDTETIDGGDGAGDAWLEIRSNNDVVYSLNLRKNAANFIAIYTDDVFVYAKIAEDDNTTWHNCGHLEEANWNETLKCCVINDSDWSYNWGQGEHMWIKLEFNYISAATMTRAPGTYYTNETSYGGLKWRIRGYTT